MKKNHKYIWCLCALAAACFLLGSFIHTRTYSMPGYDIFSGDSFTEPEATTMPPAETYMPTTAPASGAVTDGQTQRYEPTTEVPAPDSGEIDRVRKTEGTSRFFYALGILSLAGFVCIFPFSSPLLGPELEMSLGGLSAMWLYWALDEMSGDLAFGAVLAVLGTVLAVCIKGLVSWGCAKFPPGFSLTQRIIEKSLRQGKLSAGRIIALVSFGVAAAAASLAFALWTLIDYNFDRDALMFSLPLAAGCCTMLVFAVKGAKTYSRSVKNLTGQIKAVADNGEAAVSDGYFSESERELAEIGKKRDEALKKAIADERFKVELITNVSHDLRTPLTSILGYAELLKDEELSADGRERLEKLNAKAGYMRDMVEELFELTKVSSGETEAKKEKIDMLKLAEQTVGIFDDSLTAKNLTVKRHYGVSEAILETDGAMLHRVLDNLISNAVKYSPENARIHIYIDRDNGFFRVKVINTANYEMDFDTEEITKRFVRGDKTRSTSGSGLGLAIAKTYTEALGGRFEIQVEGDQFTSELMFRE